MPHIHTGPNQHDLTVTAYIVKIDSSEPKALLHMHKKLNILLPIGGHVELNETPWQATAHELAEESGYELDQLRVLQPFSRIHKMTNAVLHPYPLSLNTHDIPGGHYHTDIEYGFITSEEPRMNVGEGESVDLRWVTRSELDALGPDLIPENTREIYRFVFDEASIKWEQVNVNNFLIDDPVDSTQ